MNFVHLFSGLAARGGRQFGLAAGWSFIGGQTEFIPTAVAQESSYQSCFLCVVGTLLSCLLYTLKQGCFC